MPTASTATASKGSTNTRFTAKRASRVAPFDVGCDEPGSPDRGGSYRAADVHDDRDVAQTVTSIDGEDGDAIEQATVMSVVNVNANERDMRQAYSPAAVYRRRTRPEGPQERARPPKTLIPEVPPASVCSSDPRARSV